jgi:ATP-dependent Zn protease
MPGLSRLAALAERVLLPAKWSGCGVALRRRAVVLSGMSDIGTVSEETIPDADLDAAVRRVLAVEEGRTRQLVEGHLGALTALAQALLEEERIDGSRVRALATAVGEGEAV